MECETSKKEKSHTKFSRIRERSEHNSIERERRMIIKKEIQNLEDCLPNVKKPKGQRLSRILTVRKAISFIEDTRKVNAKLRTENSLLADENTAMERQISEIFQQQKASEYTTETDEITEISDWNEGSSLLHEATNFEEDISEFMMDDIINSQSEFWSLSQEFQ